MQLPFYLVFLLSFPSFKRHFLGPCLFSLIFRNSYFHQCGSQCTFHYFLYKIYDPYPTTMSICMLLHQQKSSCQFFLQTLKYHQQRARKFTSLDMSPFKPPPPFLHFQNDLSDTFQFPLKQFLAPASPQISRCRQTIQCSQDPSHTA